MYAAMDWESSTVAVLTGTVLTITCGRLYAATNWDSSSCWNCSFSHGRRCTRADRQKRGGFRGQRCREKPHNIAQAYHTE